MNFLTECDDDDPSYCWFFQGRAILMRKGVQVLWADGNPFLLFNQNLLHLKKFKENS